MCTYTYAPLCAATRGLKRRKLSSLSPPPATPHRVSSSRYLLSSYSIFTHRTGSLSLSLLPPHVRPLPGFVRSLPPPVSLSVSALSHTGLRASLSLTLFFLSSSFIRDYASRIAYRSGADMLLPLRCKLLMKPQGARASTCKRKGRGSVEHKDEYLS